MNNNCQTRRTSVDLFYKYNHRTRQIQSKLYFTYWTRETTSANYYFHIYHWTRQETVITSYQLFPFGNLFSYFDIHFTYTRNSAVTAISWTAHVQYTIVVVGFVWQLSQFDLLNSEPKLKLHPLCNHHRQNTIISDHAKSRCYMQWTRNCFVMFCHIKTQTVMLKYTSWYVGL